MKQISVKLLPKNCVRHKGSGYKNAKKAFTVSLIVRLLSKNESKDNDDKNEKEQQPTAVEEQPLVLVCNYDHDDDDDDNDCTGLKKFDTLLNPCWNSSTVISDEIVSCPGSPFACFISEMQALTPSSGTLKCYKSIDPFSMDSE